MRGRGRGRSSGRPPKGRGLGKHEPAPSTAALPKLGRGIGKHAPAPSSALTLYRTSVTHPLLEDIQRMARLDDQLVVTSVVYSTDLEFKAVRLKLRMPAPTVQSPDCSAPIAQRMPPMISSNPLLQPPSSWMDPSAAANIRERAVVIREGCSPSINRLLGVGSPSKSPWHRP